MDLDQHLLINENSYNMYKYSDSGQEQGTQKMQLLACISAMAIAKGARDIFLNEEEE